VLISFGVHDADEGHLCPVRLEQMRPLSVDKSERTNTLGLEVEGLSQRLVENPARIHMRVPLSVE
jgi:hypothetical protein